MSITCGNIGRQIPGPPIQELAVKHPLGFPVIQSQEAGLPPSGSFSPLLTVGWLLDFLSSSHKLSALPIPPHNPLQPFLWLDLSSVSVAESAEVWVVKARRGHAFPQS